MLVLAQTTDAFEIVLTAAPVSQLPFYATYRDITAVAYTPGRNAGTTNGTTTVTLVGAPAASTQRVIDYINIYNPNVATSEVTIKLDLNGTEFIIHKIVLAQNERLEYQEGLGWTAYTSTGSMKTSLNQGASPVQSGWQQSVLASDVINNNATANSIADVTGLQFPVVANTRYEFEFLIRYTAAATTTGSRWSINGPANNELTYSSRYSLSTTGATFNEGSTSYDLPAASNTASASTLGNIASISGIIRPTVDGNVIARFASEIASSAITAKAGSRVNYKAL